MVQLTMSTKCVYTGSCRGVDPLVKGNTKTCEGEVGVEISNVLSKVFCILIYLI